MLVHAVKEAAGAARALAVSRPYLGRSLERVGCNGEGLRRPHVMPGAIRRNYSAVLAMCWMMPLEKAFEPPEEELQVRSDRRGRPLLKRPRSLRARRARASLNASDYSDVSNSL